MAWVVTAVAAAFEVGATAAVIMTAVTEVGITMQVVGGLTGNKDLMKVGGVLSIAGGIGGAAAGGMFGESAAGAINSNIGSEAVSSGVSGGVASGVDLGYLPADSVTSAADQAALGSMGASADNIAGTLVNTATGAADTGLASGTGGVDFNQLDSGLELNGGSNAILTDKQLAGTLPGATPSAAVPALQTEIPGSALSVTTGDVAPVTVDTGAVQAPSNGSLTSANGSPINNPSAYSPTPAGASDIATAKSSGLFSSAQQWLSGLKPQTQAEILKAAMAIPGGIQAQSNKVQELALQQQRVNQTSYSSVPNYFGSGIIANAQKKV